eukprot:TRINITY_DN2503_c0_g1_i1.p1 TRINITY_DN2503_c0_g1~~TRINITY_DN2503_c0_g1_i1.p1  ORF type:complete len:216 (+),score=60.10 TRINITY_DN2503_c0_g1_i1:69-716(+)
MTTHDRASIQTLIEGNRYRVEILPELEAYVQHQVANNENHLEANLALLKLYQFYPDKTNLAIIKAILLKALTNSPNPDFLYCSPLLRESVHADEQITTISNLSNLLETAQFQKFWETLNAHPELVPAEFKNFNDAIRSFITTTLNITYQVISRDYLSLVLNLQGEELNAFITKNDWQVTGDTVRLPIVEENQAKPKKIAEHLSFEQIGKILATVH